MARSAAVVKGRNVVNPALLRYNGESIGKGIALMKHRVFWTRFFLAASILTAALIFFFSAQQGPDSSAMSDGITLALAKLLRPGLMELPPAEQLSYLEKLGFIVRKCAHFSEFALLAFNLACWLRLKFLEKPRAFAPPRAWLIATLYAGSDELHQMFVAERAPAVVDVCIDSAGALTGVLVALAGMLIIAKKAKRPSS